MAKTQKPPQVVLGSCPPKMSEFRPDEFQVKIQISTTLIKDDIKTIVSEARLKTNNSRCQTTHMHVCKPTEDFKQHNKPDFRGYGGSICVKSPNRLTRYYPLVCVFLKFCDVQILNLLLISATQLQQASRQVQQSIQMYQCLCPVHISLVIHMREQQASTYSCR